MIRAVLFDFDDTLIHTQRICLANYISAAKIMNIRIPEKKEIARLFGLPWPQIVQKLWPGINEEVYNEAYIKCRGDERYDAVENAKKIIQELKKNGLVLGILTSRGKSSIYRVIEETGFDKEDFQFIDAHHDGKYAKPNSRVFDYLKNTLSVVGINADETIYIGDSIYDYQAASGAGLHFIAFINGAYSGEEFIKAGLDNNLVMKSFQELPSLLAGNFRMEHAA